MVFAQNDVDPNAQSTGITSTSDAMFDLQFQWPVGVGGGEAGIEANGTYIYTTKWNGLVSFFIVMIWKETCSKL
ncbi:MAG: hypothetical protein R2764_11850 [Bacteroidales bacterium]